ncbi:MAG: hypothetical protein K1X75_11065 [Leptospirales bacterium]|nr:hypothetical protein [Leptospirales bacterium]
MKDYSNIGRLAVRIVLGAQLLLGFVFNLLHWPDTVATSAAMLGDSLAPWASAGAIALLGLSGLSLMFDFRPQWGAILLALFLLPATPSHILSAREARQQGEAAVAAQPEEAGRLPIRRLTEIADRGQIANVGKNLVLLAAGVWLALSAGPRSKKKAAG